MTVLVMTDLLKCKSTLLYKTDFYDPEEHENVFLDKLKILDIDIKSLQKKIYDLLEKEYNIRKAHKEKDFVSILTLSVDEEEGYVSLGTGVIKEDMIESAIDDYYVVVPALNLIKHFLH